jgi:hypothetical protein
MYKCVITHVDSSLTDPYTGFWSPSSTVLCHFKVSVLVPLEWGHQTFFMFWVFYLSTYLPYVLSHCHVNQVHQHCYICLRPKVYIWGKTYDFWSSEPGWPCSKSCSPIPSIYLWMIRFHSSSWLSKIPLCINTTFSWYIRQ